ncbi:S9 family peptidase [Pedobacter insulae]|uniref:Dipeptidyl peptidase IV (DPP IV) N-terminal region n=1 Tax=Pedobacter insulae TaxID=414048 RepID=A0A1I2V1G1_9SPHI|nr:S9 family peptidase [Pedobacter insulae]SFG82873.1 Dipeptidyl peptidase IV (DPP IV) N-terminal region [Pedobacter insulae]
MKRISYLKPALFLLISGMSFCANAQQTALQPFKPFTAEFLEVMKQASSLDTALRNVAANNSIVPFWQQDKTSFYYRKNLPGRNWEYVYVNPLAGTKKVAFDHHKLAQVLGAASGKKQEAARLRISEMFFNKNATVLTLKAEGEWFQVNLSSYNATPTTDTVYANYNRRPSFQDRRGRGRFGPNLKSPDGKKEIAFQGGNLFIKELSTNLQTQLTTDGTAEKPYGYGVWSPDSKTLVAYKSNPVKTKEISYILSSVPGTTRGELKTRPYAQPGDEFSSYEPFVFHIATKKQTKVETDILDLNGPPRIQWREGNNRYYTYEKTDRGHQRFRIIEVDTQTGKTRNVVDEKTNTFIYQNRVFTSYLPKTNEIIWTSEQDGWQHVYLVNGITGKQHQITKGNWVVRNVDSVDQVKRQLWFRASGVNSNEDPYYIHYYRIGFDGKGMLDLTPEKGNHTVTYTPDKKYYIDTYSQVNIAPVMEFRRVADGKKLMEVERGSAAAYLATGVKLPEPFMAKGRDGITDIWGVICRPSHLDPNKTYPVIENIYAGPQDSFVPKNFMPVSEMQSIAELGFIVVQIDGMGTANRSKAFHDVAWKNLADAGFPDRIAWMKAMATKYPYADISRVGVYGTSAGGQNSAGALLFHPEFYKTAVSACGCHDNRVDKQWWNEQWMGYPVGPHYAAQSNITNAHKLEGDLLLIVGEADENVPAESTYRMGDALIKANKDFEILTIPGMGHSDGGTYGRRRKREFFIKHLLNIELPSRNNQTATR